MEDRSEDPGTRETILQLIAERGPVTAAQLAKILYLTPAAVRRHVGSLEADRLIEVHKTAGPAKPRRGRPARHYVTTNQGQSRLENTYADFATQALDFIRREMGDDKIEEFASARVADLEERYTAVVENAGPDPTRRAHALVKALNEDGFAASLRAVGPRGFALQLCQGHCPVLDVAGHAPELCEEETKAFSRLLGLHVQRLATLAGGDHVCTTHIPLLIPSSRARAGNSRPSDATEGNS